MGEKFSGMLASLYLVNSAGELYPPYHLPEEGKKARITTDRFEDRNVPNGAEVRIMIINSADKNGLVLVKYEDGTRLGTKLTVRAENILPLNHDTLRADFIDEYSRPRQ